MTEYETITPEQIARLEAKARRLQSEAFRAALTGLFTRIRGLFAAPVAKVRRAA